MLEKNFTHRRYLPPFIDLSVIPRRVKIPQNVGFLWKIKILGDGDTSAHSTALTSRPSHELKS